MIRRKFAWQTESPVPAEWFDLERIEMKRERTIVVCDVPRVWWAEEEDGTLEFHTEWRRMSIAVPDRSNIGDVQMWFAAAYPESVIIEIKVEVLTD